MKRPTTIAWVLVHYCSCWFSSRKEVGNWRSSNRHSQSVAHPLDPQTLRGSLCASFLPEWAHLPVIGACSGSHLGCRIGRHPAARSSRQDARPYGRQGCLPLPTTRRYTPALCTARHQAPLFWLVKTAKQPAIQSGGDVVLLEVWRVKDALSAARGHDVHRLFDEARKRQKTSAHPVMNLQKRQAGLRKAVAVG